MHGISWSTQSDSLQLSIDQDRLKTVLSVELVKKIHKKILFKIKIILVSKIKETNKK